MKKGAQRIHGHFKVDIALGPNDDRLVSGVEWTRHYSRGGAFGKNEVVTSYPPCNGVAVKNKPAHSIVAGNSVGVEVFDRAVPTVGGKFDFEGIVLLSAPDQNECKEHPSHSTKKRRNYATVYQ